MTREKTGQEVGATVDVKPEEVTVTAALQAEIGALRAELDKANTEIQVAQAELAAAQEHNAESERLPEAGLVPGSISDGKTLTPKAEAAFYTGSGAPAINAEVVAIKSKHDHVFLRTGYHAQLYWTFVRHADSEPAGFERLIGNRMVEARKVLPMDAS